MAVVRELITRWGFQVDDKPLTDLENGINNLKNSVLVVGAAAIAAAGSLFGLAQSVANIGDEARKTAQGLGLTTEKLQQMQFAASIAGVKSQDFFNSLRKLTKTMSDASQGLVTYKKTYDALGISVTDVNGELRGSDEVLADVADKFAAMPDNAKKTAFALELFGRSGARLIPFLNEGSKGIAKLGAEASALGFVMSEKTAKAAEEFNDAITRLQAVARGLQIIIGEKLMPVITRLIDGFRKWVIQNNKIIKSKINNFLKNLISFLEIVWGVTKRATTAGLVLTKMFGGLEKIIKAVVTTMLILAGTSMLISIGLIARSIFRLGKAFKFAKIQARLLWASTLIGPFLIGVAVIALGLIIEDLYTFLFTEGTSVTAKLVPAFAKLWTSFKDGAIKAFDSVVGPFRSLRDDIEKNSDDMIKSMMNAWSGFKDWIKNIFLSINDFIGNMALKAVATMANMILKLVSTIKSIPIIGKIFSGIDTKSLETGINAINTITTSSPQSAPVPGQSTQNVTVSPNIKIEVPPGTAPELVGSAVTKGIDNAISKMLREASSATRPQEAF